MEETGQIQTSTHIEVVPKPITSAENPSLYNSKWNYYSILSIAIMFPFPPLAFVAGYILYKQIQKTKEKGLWLSVIAMIYGGGITAIMVLFLIAGILIAFDPNYP